jgi:catechol 2,3-dioxygenase-like lactoylglutathione lyase family enzyme
MTILGLQLTTDRIDQIRDFYSGTLMLPIVEEREDTCAFQAGFTKLFFTLAEEDTQPSHAFGFAVPSERFDDVVAELGQVIQLYAPDPGASRPTVYFSDPANNAVSIVALDALAHDDELANPLSLNAVSELTFVVDDVQDVRQLLEAHFEFSAYPMSSGTRVAMRGVDTTLYLVPRGETLLPDGGATAEIFPIMMTLAGTVNAVDRVGEYPYYIHVADITGSPGVTGARIEARPV